MEVFHAGRVFTYHWTSSCIRACALSWWQSSENKRMFTITMNVQWRDGSSKEWRLAEQALLSFRAKRKKKGAEYGTQRQKKTRTHSERSKTENTRNNKTNTVTKTKRSSEHSKKQMLPTTSKNHGHDHTTSKHKHVRWCRLFRTGHKNFTRGGSF